MGVNCHEEDWELRLYYQMNGFQIDIKIDISSISYKSAVMWTTQDLTDFQQRWSR